MLGAKVSKATVDLNKRIFFSYSSFFFKHVICSAFIQMYIKPERTQNMTHRPKGNGPLTDKKRTRFLKEEKGNQNNRDKLIE